MPDAPAMTAPSSVSSVTFADLLRHHRAAAGLTQEELAARAGLSSDAISTLERGARRRPRKDTVALLAEALALPDEERAALATAARRSSAAALAATPPAEAAFLDGHAPVTAALDGDAPASGTTLPHGVVTFLIAEIEDATSLLHVLGDRYGGVLAEMQALLRDVWAAHAGHELGTQGDRFFAVFADADDALSAAAAAQQALVAHTWPDGARMLLQMGVHSGPALLTAGRYVGQEVHRAACIAAAGHGGQVLVSGTVADQVAKFGYELPAGTKLQDLGKHRLHDLGHRESLSELVLLDLPGLPVSYPPLRTLDAWPGLRADLSALTLVSAVLLPVVGLLLPLVVPAFPWAVGLGMSGLAGVVLMTVALARPVRRALAGQWHAARKPFVGVTSAVLSLAVISTTLFLTKPPIFIGPKHLGYDFSYTYHAPTRQGGSITIGLLGALQTLAPYSGPGPVAAQELYYGLWQGCVTQLPDTNLGLPGWKPDQCTEVPTVANGGESPDGRTTTFHIDPRAVWSDGAPITADDYLLAYHLLTDLNLGGGGYPWNQMRLTAPDPTTVRIDWSAAFVDYLPLLSGGLGGLVPVPLHAFATGPFAGIYVPASGAYNSALAQQLVASTRFIAAMYPDNGPFTVQSFDPNHQAVLVRNPRFFSNYFHAPALDRVTFVTVNPQWGTKQQLTEPQAAAALIASYRLGGVGFVDDLSPLNLRQLGGIPKEEVITSPVVSLLDIGFNQRPQAPNAQANGGVSIFTDPKVRKAFVEAFDRCAAVRTQLGITTNCADPNLFTDEITTPPAPDYDPTVTLPRYNPADAAHLMDKAGYPVVDGVRRYKDGKTPLQISIDVSGGAAQAPLIARAMQQDYARNLKIGVTLVVAPDFFAGSFTRGGAGMTGTFDIAFYSDTGSPDPDFNAGMILGSTDTADIPSAQHPYGYNFLGVVDPWVVQQEQLAGQTFDYGQRTSVLRNVRAHVAQQFLIEPAVITADVTLVKPTLCNYKKWPQPGYNTWNMADWYLAPSCP